MRKPSFAARSQNPDTTKKEYFYFSDIYLKSQDMARLMLPAHEILAGLSRLACWRHAMNRTLLVGLLFLSPATAGADELYQRPRRVAQAAPVYDWTGVYFGVHFDMAQQPTTIHSTVQQSTGSYDAGSPYGTLNLSSRGLMGGVQFGYNQQIGALVVGFEGDGSVGSLKSSKTTDVPGLQQTEAKYSSADTSFASLRGRLGIAANNVLIYGAFGGAVRANELKRTQYATTSPQYASGAQAAAADYSTVPVFVETAQKSQTGLTMGGGVEYASSLGWSVYASYLLTRWSKSVSQTPMALDSVFSYTASSTANGRDNHIDATTQTFRLGLNYKL